MKTVQLTEYCDESENLCSMWQWRNESVISAGCRASFHLACQKVLCRCVWKLVCHIMRAHHTDKSMCPHHLECITIHLGADRSWQLDNICPGSICSWVRGSDSSLSFPAIAHTCLHNQTEGIDSCSRVCLDRGLCCYSALLFPICAPWLFDQDGWKVDDNGICNALLTVLTEMCFVRLYLSIFRWIWSHSFGNYHNFNSTY